MTLRELRKERGLTQPYVASYLGVRPMLISRYERGVKPLPKQHAFMLAYLYGVRPDAIDEWRHKQNTPLPPTPVLVRRSKAEILKLLSSK